MSYNNISPIGGKQITEVIEQTCEYIGKASVLFDAEFDLIPVHFDLKGRSAGCYQVKGDQKIIRYNPFIFAKYYQDNLSNTVPHEVAHYIADRLYGRINIRPHGREWKHIMRQFGKVPMVTSRYDLSGIPVRKAKTHPYHCGCQIHQLTARRHNKIINKQAEYICRRCGTPLAFDRQNNG